MKSTKLFLRSQAGASIWSQDAAQLEKVIQGWHKEVPQDKSSTEYELWLNKLNLLYETYNQMVGREVYCVIKPKNK